MTNEDGSIVINENTFNLLLEKFFTIRNTKETSIKYKTFFPAMKYYKYLKGFIDAVRINKECFFPEKKDPYWNATISNTPDRKRSFFCIRNEYWNAEKTKCYKVICIHNNLAFDRIPRDITEIIPKRILLEMEGR